MEVQHLQMEKEKSVITFTADNDFRLTLVAAQKGSAVPELKYVKDAVLQLHLQMQYLKRVQQLSTQ